MIKPYNRVSLAFLGSEVGVDEIQVESLVAQLILDGKLAEARIDQHRRILDLGVSQSHVKRRYDALQSWSKTLTSVNENLNARAVSSANPFSPGGLALGMDLMDV